MTVHPVAEAFPGSAGSPQSVSVDTVRQKQAAAFPLVIAAADDIQEMDFRATNALAVPEVVVVRETGVIYLRAVGNTDEHDGIVTLVSASDDHYVAKEIVPEAFVNVLAVIETLPGTEMPGDRYIVGQAPTGELADHADELIVITSSGLVPVMPKIGQRVYVRALKKDLQWGEDGAWVDPASFAGAVGASELAFPWGMVVEGETTVFPGTRVTGATPTMPLGGTAANINDDDGNTTATTGAIGNKTGAVLADRVFAKLDLGAVKELAAIELKGVKASAGASSAGAMGLYYSTDDVALTQLGAGFAIDTNALDVARSDTDGVSARYVYAVTEAKDWGAATHTVGDLNAYTKGTTAADGTKVIAAANSIGVMSGHDTEIAEAQGGAVIFHTPYDGAEVGNKAIKARQRFDASEGKWLNVASGYASVARFREADEELIGNTSAVVSTGYLYDPDSPPSDTNDGSVADETLVATVQADFPGQVVHVDYIASVIVPFSVSIGTGSASSVTDFSITGALYLDAGTDALAHEPVYYLRQTAGVVEQSPLRTVRPNLHFEITLNDTLPHTLRLRFHAGVNNNASINVLQARLAARLFEVKKVSQ